jgi:hypothetical protein
MWPAACRRSPRESVGDLKNHVEMGRFRTHRNEAADGKMFCAFIARTVSPNKPTQGASFAHPVVPPADTLGMVAVA